MSKSFFHWRYYRRSSNNCRPLLLQWLQEHPGWDIDGAPRFVRFVVHSVSVSVRAPVYSNFAHKYGKLNSICSRPGAAPCCRCC